MTIRSKHNNLLNYFIYDNKDLSKEYKRKCKIFFKEIESNNKEYKRKNNKKNYGWHNLATIVC